MTNPTPHGQVPEALLHASYLESIFVSEEVPASRAGRIAKELRRLHAYCQELESQMILDCMTHVQKPAEIEHVAGDVSKNGAESNMPELAHEIFALAQLAPGEGIEDAVARIAAALRTQHPAPAGATYKDSTPQLNVGDSAFESWYATYNPAHKADKQRARDAYAAGMGDPLVIVAPTAQPAPATQQAGATKEHLRLVRVIADKIEDGTLFQSGIYSNKDLARFVRNVADSAAPQPSHTAQAGAVPTEKGERHAS